MKNNKKHKIPLFMAIIISVSLIISSLTIIINSYNNNDGMWTSYMHEDKKILETDFLKSRAFEFKVLRPITAYITNVALQNHVKQYSLSQLKQYEQIDFVVLNKDTNLYYTNILNKYEVDKTKYNEILNKIKNNKNNKALIHITSKNNKSTYSKQLGSESINTTTSNNELVDVLLDSNVDIYISFENLEKVSLSNMISDTYKYYNYSVKNVVVAFILLIIALFTLIISTIYYKKIDNKIDLNQSKIFKLFRKIPLEVNIFLVVIIFMYLWSVCMGVWDPYNILKTIFINVVVIFTTIIYGYLTYEKYKLTDKKADLFKESIVYLIFSSGYKIYKQINGLEHKVSYINNIIILTVLAIVSMTAILIIAYTTAIWYYPVFWLVICIVIPSITIIIVSSYIIKQLIYISEIIDTTEKIKNGQIDEKVAIKGNNDITKLAQNINSIGEGLDIAIEKQVKSERMKSELITNVSHDLKTPLTSIMNYIQLINKEENISPEHIKDYINVIDSKSKRLKALIEDLFEASKASSGNIELNIEKIDLGQLLRQSIGEMEEKLLESNLDIKLNINEEKIYIDADGRRMYRVLENLLSNISKYTLPNTRVYIDLYEKDNKVNLIMKNISAYELNFDPSEIVERFKRGDESRNTEGSGLGLSIAKDLVNLQGGEFHIEIDGDLFKSILSFESNKN